MSDASSAIELTSFGAKYGSHPEADVVLDVRFLPNPYWVLELRDQNGLSAPVSEYVLSQPHVDGYLAAIVELLGITAVGFAADSKPVVRVAIGCTGGKHRSVAVVTALLSRLQALGLTVTVSHRDLGLE